MIIEKALILLGFKHLAFLILCYMLTVMLTVKPLILLHFKHFSWLKNHAFTHIKYRKVMDLLTFPVAHLLIFWSSAPDWLKIPSISYVLGNIRIIHEHFTVNNFDHFFEYR
mgnify:CR=1 FL=1